MVWKGDANNRLANSLITLFDDVEKSFPNRKRKGNDGTIGDKKHQASPISDHNPHVEFNGMGIVTALDITDDPVNGFDARTFAESLRKAKDPRIQYVIFDGKIFSSKVSPWIWRDRNKGPGDHSEHVHISVVSEQKLFDSEDPWTFDKSQSAQSADTVPPSRPKLRLGDSGPAVVDLQNRLGIKAHGIFDELTDQAVRAFQTSRNLLDDGIVGPHTWGLLTEASSAPAGGPAAVRLPASVLDEILKLAGNSALSRVDWAKRGIAPVGYIKGMAVAFAYVYAKFKTGDAAAQIMSAANGGHGSDALAWYDPIFRTANMDNSVSGAATLRHLFVLLIGLGMRESSGKYFVGRDTTATNEEADSAEAGLFQMSWNMRSASPEMAKLFAAYSTDSEGFLSIFTEGAPEPKASDLENFGTGEGVAYQKLAKSCPAFAVETAAVGLRVRREHWGPINRHEAEIRPEADALLTQVQGIIDARGPIVLVPPGAPSTTANDQQLLALLLAILSKGKKMADTSTTSAQNTDLLKALLPFLIEHATSGKPLDAAQLAAILAGEKPVVTPTPQPAQTDPISQLISAIAGLIVPKLDPASTLPVTNALGTTIGNLLDGKKTAIGAIGALVTSILSFATTAAPPAVAVATGGAATGAVVAGGATTTTVAGTAGLSAIGQVLAPLIPAAGLSGFAMPIFLALAGWGVLSKMEKWTKEVEAAKK